MFCSLHAARNVKTSERVTDRWRQKLADYMCLCQRSPKDCSGTEMFAAANNQAGPDSCR